MNAPTRRRISRLLTSVLAAVVLFASVLGVIASTHEAIHELSGTSELAYGHGLGDDKIRAPVPDGVSSFADLLHSITLAMHCCSVTIALLSTPVFRPSLSLPPLVPRFEVRVWPATAIQGLFRPPIR